MTDIINNNETNLRERFVEKVRSEVGKGIYVWGGNGEILNAMHDPTGWIERRETSEANRRRVFALYAKRLQDGVQVVRAFDCSGLVYWALKDLGVLEKDVSSRGLYDLCEPIGEKALLPGDLVFHHDGTRIVHVGVCAGKTQIECRGRDVGVVENTRKAGYWNRFGRLTQLDRKDGKHVRICGGSVRVREGDGTHTRCIGIVHRGERFPLLGRAPSGWYRILWRGREAFITNKPQYTEVCHG